MSKLKSLVQYLVFMLFFGYGTLDGKAKEQPNIVWITSEDNSKHYMELFDEHGVSTPHIERLAEEGLRFTHAFSNAAVSSAARSTLISGCYGPALASHYHRSAEKVPMPDSLDMFPAYLKDVGYYTANNHKEDYNIIKPDGVWDDSSPKASWRNRAEGQAFFYVHNLHATHEGQLHFTKEEMETRSTSLPPDSAFIQPNYPDDEIFRYTYAYYCDLNQKMDQEVGEVIKELKKDGLLENTFIFYYGDHGGVLPGSKGYLAETGLHVPLVVYIPEKYKQLSCMEKGSSVEGFVSFVDFGATVLNLAGIAVPEGMMGKAFLGENIDADELNQRQETYSYADRFDEKYDMVRAVRKGKYKYVRNYQPFNFEGLMNNYRYKQLAYQDWQNQFRQDQLNETQAYFFNTKAPEWLFDVEADPYETNNLAENPAYRSTLKSMRGKLHAWQDEIVDLSFYPEYFLVEHAFQSPEKFGEAHKEDLARYSEIADLQLIDFGDAKAQLESFLNSEDPFDRYWALISSSRFEIEAEVLTSTIKAIAKADPVLINRVRAAEFLGIIRAEDPVQTMMDALYQSDDSMEALLILNSIVLMQDGYDYEFDVQAEQLQASVLEQKFVQWRLKYLATE